MTRHAASLGLLALLAGSVLAVNNSVPLPTEARRVSDLVEQLGSPDYMARESATKELERIGPAALAELRKALAGVSDGEVHRRASQLVARFEKRLADEKVLAPRMVQLNAENKKLERVLADLSAQSGYEVKVKGSVAKSISLKTGRVTFWQAVEQVCDAADLQIAAVGPISAPNTIIPLKPGQKAPAVPAPPQALPTPGGAAVPARPVFPVASIDKLRQDLEKIEKARAEVLKEVNGKKRAEELAKIKAEMQMKLQAAERLQALKEQAKQAAAPPQVVNPPAKPLPGPGPIAQQIQIALRKPVPPVFNGPAPPPGPGNPSHTILLEARRGQKRPSANFGAIRLEALALPAEAGVPDAVAGLIQVWAEPNLQWQQVRGLRVRQARDESGQSLVPDMSGELAYAPQVMDGNGMQIVRNVNGGVIFVNGGGRVVIQGNVQGNIIVNGGQVIVNGTEVQPASANTGPFQPNPLQAVFKLQTGEKKSETIADMSGAVEAVVRTRPDALITVADLAKGGEQRHPAGARLKAAELHKADDGSYTVEVVVEHDANAVQMASSNGEPVVNGPVNFPVRRGMIVRGGRRGFPIQAVNGEQPVNYLQVKDEEGAPYTVSQTGASQFSSNGFTNEMKMTLKLTPSIKGQAAPKTMALWGTRLASVEVPFKLSGVPILTAKK